MRSLAVLLLVALTAACDAQPRSATYFHAHPVIAQNVADACRSGSYRGDECVNAEAGLSAVRRDERLEMFRRGAGR